MNKLYFTAKFISEGIMPFSIKSALRELKKIEQGKNNFNFIVQNCINNNKDTSFSYEQWEYILEWALDLS